MREILFRAKRVDNGEWVEGFYVKCRKYDYILPIFNEYEPFHGYDDRYDEWVEIDPETLCQFTRLKDKNGSIIWENDIVKHEISDTIGTVKWYQEDYVGWCVDDVMIDEQQFTDEMWSECEVIGNVFDHSELLEGE